MIVTDYKKHRRLEQKRRQLYLPMLSFDLGDIVGEAIRTCFPQTRPCVAVGFCVNDTLACILLNEKCSNVLIHVVLNDEQTPRQVLSHIITHEMLHLLIPPEEIEGRLVSHPESFWQKERQIIPERSQSWSWIRTNFYGCVRLDEKTESTVVKANWRKFAGQERCPWHTCSSLVQDQMY